jgi:hypothetical protein
MIFVACILIRLNHFDALALNFHKIISSIAVASAFWILDVLRPKCPISVTHVSCSAIVLLGKMALTVPSEDYNWPVTVTTRSKA